MMTSPVQPKTVIGAAVAAAANIFLLSGIVWSLVGNSTISSEKIYWSAGLSASIDSAFSRKPIDAYSEVLVRPVFFRSRGPFVPAPPHSSTVAVAAPSPPPDPSFVLGGVMMNDSVRKAYVFSRNGVGGEWIAEGEDFMGWRVGSIGQGSAKLEQAGRRIDLQLYPRE
jgi:hypothetical protein